VEPSTEGGEDTVHFHLDHLGSPRQVTDEFGAQAAFHTYYPFGEEATDPSQDDVELKFTGHERDENGGGAGVLDYMHARYCSPTIGRLFTTDPIPGDRRRPQSWNLYGYVENNPVSYTDPTGLDLFYFSADVKADLCDLVGPSCADHLSFENSLITVTATAEELEANEALRLLSEFADSQKVYGVYIGEQLPVDGGHVTLGRGLGEFAAKNISENKDHRSGAPLLPPGGFSGITGISPDFEQIMISKDGLPTHRPSALFHELAENYYRTEKMKQYRDAHALAIRDEIRLRSQRPELNHYGFGAGPYSRDTRR
jgi:RHS repeat-associated protein